METTSRGDNFCEHLLPVRQGNTVNLELFLPQIYRKLLSCYSQPDGTTGLTFIGVLGFGQETGRLDPLFYIARQVPYDYLITVMQLNVHLQFNIDTILHRAIPTVLNGYQVKIYRKLN